MNHNDYQPVGYTLGRVAPTEKQFDESVLYSVVHDSLTLVMKGNLSGVSTNGHTGYSGTSIIIDPTTKSPSSS